MCCCWCWQLCTAADADSYIRWGIHTHTEMEETAWKVHTNKDVLSSTKHTSSTSPASNLTPSQLPHHLPAIWHLHNFHKDSSCQGCSESDNIYFSNSGKRYISWSSHANDELETVKWEEKRKSTRESAAVFSRASFFRKAWGGIKNWFCTNNTHNHVKCFCLGCEPQNCTGSLFVNDTNWQGYLPTWYKIYVL